MAAIITIVKEHSRNSGRAKLVRLQNQLFMKIEHRLPLGVRLKEPPRRQAHGKATF
jgi:hypothetical protein